MYIYLESYVPIPQSLLFISNSGLLFFFELLFSCAFRHIPFWFEQMYRSDLVDIPVGSHNVLPNSGADGIGLKSILFLTDCDPTCHVRVRFITPIPCAFYYIFKYMCVSDKKRLVWTPKLSMFTCYYYVCAIGGERRGKRLSYKQHILAITVGVIIADMNYTYTRQYPNILRRKVITIFIGMHVCTIHVDIACLYMTISKHTTQKSSNYVHWNVQMYIQYIKRNTLPVYKTIAAMLEA